MNVLFISSEKNFRGGEKQTLYLIDSLQRYNIKCSLSCSQNTDLFKKIQNDNINYIPLPSYTNISTFVKQCASYDIIHTLSSKATEIALFLNPFVRKPIIYTRRVSYPLNNVLSITKLKLVNKITVLTNYYKKYLEGLGLNDVSVIPDMVVKRDLNAERAKQLVEKLGIAQNFIIGTISALEDSKDPFTLLNAFKKLSNECQKISVLHFGDGKLKSKITKFIGENNLQNRYFLMNTMDDVEDFYSVFNLFILCSKIEGMGSSILDAYLYNVSTLVTNILPIREYAQDKSMFFEKSDSDSLYKELKNIIEAKYDMTKLQESAYDYVTTYHSQQKITKLHIDEYKKLRRLP